MAQQKSTTTNHPSKPVPSKPVHTIRSGAFSVSIWKRESENGPWYAANVQRSYKAAEDEWKYSDSFGRDDLPVAARLLEMAHTWIIYNEAKTAGQSQPR